MDGCQITHRPMSSVRQGSEKRCNTGVGLEPFSLWAATHSPTTQICIGPWNTFALRPFVSTNAVLACSMAAGRHNSHSHAKD